MTKELLESYQSKKQEITELQSMILRLEKGDAMIGNDIILDYRKGYPRPRAVVGRDRKKIERLKSRYCARISVLEEECQEVEDFIENIPDSLTRRIFRKSFIEGRTQEKVSRDVHLSQSSVSKKINDFMKLE